MYMGASLLVAVEDFSGPLVTASGMPPPQKASMQSTDFKEHESGACRRSDAHSEVHHRPILERQTHDTLRRVCCCLPFAKILKVVVSECEPLTKEYCSKIDARWSGRFSEPFGQGAGRKTASVRQQGEAARMGRERDGGGMERDGRQQADDNKGETVDCTTTTDKHGR